MIETDIKLAAVCRRAGPRAWFLAVVLAFVPASGWAARVPAAKLERQDENRVVFRVTVPDARLLPSSAIPGAERLEINGYDRLGAPGSPPTLSRSFLVGLPETGAYSVSFRVLATTDLGTHRLEPVATPVGIHDDELGPGISERVIWNDAVFAAYQDPPTVTADSVVYVRHQRAVPVRVRPVSYNPATHSLALAREIEITVRFAAPPARDGVPVTNDGKDWDEIYGRLLVNASQAAAWRSAPSLEPDNLSTQRRVVPGAVKVRVYVTGMHSVRASRAIGAGFPAGQAVADVRLFRRSYSDVTLLAAEEEIASEVQEDGAGTAGIFDGNDQLVFYGRRLRDDTAQGDTREQYSTYNVYWLEPSPGTRMPERAPATGFVSPDTATVSFPVTALRFETDLVFREGTPPSINDYYYYNFGFEAGPVDMPFNVESALPGSNVTITADLHGQTYESPRAIELSLVNSNGEQVLNPAFGVPGKARRAFTANVPAADFDLGVNQFRLNRPDTPPRTSMQVLLNFVDISYSSLYRARGNTLRFNSATLAGDTSLTVTGITSSNGLSLYDLTNPLAPDRVQLSPVHFQPATGGTALSFRESLSGRREYLLVPAARIVSVQPADIVADTPSTLIGGGAEAGVDVLVVSHKNFIPTMRAWVSYRRAQGYRVLMADVDDVYDEFNGGVPNARAVSRFARHFFENGNAGSLVLVGDSSEDHKQIHDDSGRNYVPTFTRIDNVSVLALDEVVTSDKKLVKFPNPGGGVDVIPDMIIGRFPVGEVGELETILAKVFAYEKPGLSDFWRKRMIIVADDEFSEGSSSFGGFQFCNNNESGFQTGQENTAQIIENSLPAGYDVIRFYLKNYTDAFYTTECANRFAAITYVRQNVTERLMNELNLGATLVTIQSHMNRYVVTHERLLSGEPASILNGPTGRDYLRCENRFKPWIIFGMGCHFSEYAIHRELAPDRLLYNSPNGDAFAEQYLFQEERGAVGTYGSTGFEYLDRNVSYMNVTAAVWFYEAPYDTMVNQTNAEWKFGQLMYLVEAQMAASSSFQAESVERYHILGDPLLRIDAGPPAFNVTVNGNAAQSGDVVGGETDTLQVMAIVTDENAIHKFSLEVDGADLTDSLTVVRLSDPDLPHARQYQVSFRHTLLPRDYDIVLRAFQAPDTTSGQYHMAAEFRLLVESSISVSVNGRAIESGANVPADGNYRIDLSFPVFVPESEIVVEIDDAPVPGIQFSHPAPDDSLAWIITFRKTLDAGEHHLHIQAGEIEFDYELVVSESAGLSDVINYPNPFRGAGTNFVYRNEVEIVDGNIDIFTVSGKKVRRLDIPAGARLPGQNAVFWDGRDSAGGALANGVYLYVINVRQRSGNATVRGTTNKIE